MNGIEAAAPPSVVWAMVLRHARQRLERLGERLGAPVLFLKAAWADPVLYGDQGLRLGSDVDVLVPPCRFHDFSRALQAEGYRQWVPRGYRLTERHASHAWAFACDARPGEPVIDLHRGLSDYWCTVDVDALFARARRYDSPAGPVPSLGPEDQVLYAVIHHLNHHFTLDGRHAEDVVRLGATLPIDWELAAHRAREAGVLVPFHLLCDDLRARGTQLPDLPRPERRLALARRLLPPGGETRERRRWLLLRWLLLSNRRARVALRAGRYALMRAGDEIRWPAPANRAYPPG